MHLYKPEINKGFGFEVETCCGAISYSNQWNPNWPDFYFERRLRRLVNMLKSEELKKLFETLILKKSEFFEGLEITPAIGRSRLKSSLYKIRLGNTGFFYKTLHIFLDFWLVHGDMWSGNFAMTPSGQPALYDPGSFWGHHEFEFGMIDLFGNLGSDFFRGYRSLIPESPGFSKRRKLYKLFHLLNHWALFGSSYKNSSLSLIKLLVQ